MTVALTHEAIQRDGAAPSGQEDAWLCWRTGFSTVSETEPSADVLPVALEIWNRSRGLLVTALSSGEGTCAQVCGLCNPDA